MLLHIGTTISKPDTRKALTDDTEIDVTYFFMTSK